jgi:hypothetical protein
MLAHLWGGIAGACLTAGVVASILFFEPPEYPGAVVGVFLGLAAIGPAVAFFNYRKPLELSRHTLELLLKDGTKLTLVCDWFPNIVSETYIRGSFKILLDERMVDRPLDTVEPNKIRQWVEQAITPSVREHRFSVFRFHLTGITDPPRPGPAGGIIIGDYDR